MDDRRAREEASGPPSGAYGPKGDDGGDCDDAACAELSVLPQLLKHGKLCYRFADEVQGAQEATRPVGQALTDEDPARLFAVAQSKPGWFFAYVAATLDFFCGLRACEIRGLQWKHISREERRLRSSIEDRGGLAGPVTQRDLPAPSLSCTGALHNSDWLSQSTSCFRGTVSIGDWTRPAP